MSEEWTAEQWLQWLRRGPSAPLPSRQGLNDCADALAKAIKNLRRLEDPISHREANK
jgi:hypothetical protein